MAIFAPGPSPLQIAAMAAPVGGLRKELLTFSFAATGRGPLSQSQASSNSDFYLISCRLARSSNTARSPLAAGHRIHSTARDRAGEVDHAIEIAEKIDVCSSGAELLCSALPVIYRAGFDSGRPIFALLTDPVIEADAASEKTLDQRTLRLLPSVCI
jgi:hypothetical protein